MDPLALAVALAYASLLLELVAFAVPSEASVVRLMLEGDAGASAALARARRRPLPRKLAFFFLPTALCIAMFCVPLLLLAFPAAIVALGPLPLAHPAVQGAGIALIGLGRAVSLAAVLQLRRARGGGREVAALQRSGLFRWSRNPGLVGMFAFALGNALVFPCVALLAGLVVYLANMHRRVQLEESQLQHVLGPTYAAYRAAVPRYLGLREQVLPLREQVLPLREQAPS